MPDVNQFHPGNPINNQDPNVPKRHSTFNPNFRLADTYRFGELHPHFVAETVPSDIGYKLQCKSSIDTFTLKAPLKSGVKVHRDYFEVPMQCILPMQQDRVYQNPNIGDDCPADAGTFVDFFDTIVADYVNSLSNLNQGHVDLDESGKLIIDFSSDIPEIVSNVINYLIQAEYFYSAGSLVNVLGHSMIGRFNGYILDDDGNKLNSFDKVFDYVFSKIFDAIESIEYNHDGDGVADEKAYFGEWTSQIAAHYYRNQRTFLEDLRDNGGLTEITDIYWKDGHSTDDFKYLFAKLFTIDLTGTSATYGYTAYNDEGLDVARLFAYQIVSSHFYTNDKVDYIYSAELYRQNLFNCIQLLGVDSGLDVEPGGDIDTVFSYNGLNLQYDYLSGHFLGTLLSNGNLMSVSLFGKYLSLIFAYRHSLRFVDYFVGAKTRPFAIGDLNVPVTAGVGVNIVDTVRKKWLARFLNAIQKSGRKPSNYTQALFGTDVAYDYHDPRYLGDTADELFTDTTQNTGEAQMDQKLSITANLRSASNRFAFDFNTDREGILIGITWFDVPRLYAHSTDKIMFHQDRFDKFNPMFEFTGDQPIKFAELSDMSGPLTGDTFGYTAKYMEYKQRISRCVGGFVENLPGYVFQADNAVGVPMKNNISPSYIRSSNAELDEFYTSLTGWSIGSYFHFIVINDNMCEAKRPMSHNPSIM